MSPFPRDEPTLRPRQPADARDRADPDGAGPLTSPVTQYAYDQGHKRGRGSLLPRESLLPRWGHKRGRGSLLPRESLLPRWILSQTGRLSPFSRRNGGMTASSEPQSIFGRRTIEQYARNDPRPLLRPDPMCHDIASHRTRLATAVGVRQRFRQRLHLRQPGPADPGPAGRADRRQRGRQAGRFRLRRRQPTGRPEPLQRSGRHASLSSQTGWTYDAD